MFYVLNMYNVILSYKDTTIFKAGPVSTQSSAEALLIACVGKQMIADSASIIEVAEKVIVPEGYKSVEIADDVKILIKESLIDAATGVSAEKQRGIDVLKKIADENICLAHQHNADVLDKITSTCPNFKDAIVDVSRGDVVTRRCRFCGSIADTAKNLMREDLIDQSDENKANAVRMFNDDGSQTEIKLNDVMLAPELLEVARSPIFPITFANDADTAKHGAPTTKIIPITTNDIGGYTTLEVNVEHLLDVACSPVRGVTATEPTIVEGTLPHSQIPSLYDEGKGYNFDDTNVAPFDTDVTSLTS